MMLVHHELAITCNLCNVNGMHASKKPTWIDSACFTWLAAFIYRVTKGRQKPTLTGLACFANLLATTFSCQPPIIRRSSLVFAPLEGPLPCLFKFAVCCPIAWWLNTSGAKWWHGALDGGFELPVSHTEIPENLINLMDSALRETEHPDQERHQNLLPVWGKAFFLSTSSTCDHVLHRQKPESQPKTHVQRRRH